MKTLLVLLAPLAALAQPMETLDGGVPPAVIAEPAPSAVVAPAPAATVVAEPPPAVPAPWSCAATEGQAPLEGPVALGFFEADFATGRRACARTEIGLGGRFGAIIDTPNFYGNLGVDGVLFGSYAVNPLVELFGTVEAVQYTYVQNASIKGSSLTLGNATVGATKRFDTGESKWLPAVTARLLLPTASNIPGARLLGAEVGALFSLRAPGDLHWLEVHGFVGGNFTGAFFGQGPALPFVTITGLAGVQLSWWRWFAVVVDLNGRIGPRSGLAPAFALRFRVFQVNAELAATLPVVGTDRHDFMLGLRVSYGF